TKDFNGTVQLSYQVSDGNNGLTSASNSFLVNKANNTAPSSVTPISDQYTEESKGFNFQLVQDAFVDLDGDILTYSAILEDGSDLPSWLSFDAVTRTFSGTPSFDDASVLRVKVVASDGQATASQIFTLDVLDVNRAPIHISNTPFVMDEDGGSVKIDVLARVQDPDGDSYVISNVNVDAAQGSIVLNADKTISFTPTKDFNGTAQVSYQVDDGRGGVVQITENIVVNPVNDAPVLSSTAAVLPNGTEDQSYLIDVNQLLQGFSDVDGGTLSVVNLQATNGSLVDNQNGTYSFNPTKDFNGTIQLTYQVSDGNNGLTSASNSFVINAVNDAPVLSSTAAVLPNGT
ncbi:MAG TPA: cadherin-like domain-containing protein, partial [Agitococcus sp.]|nr:cadherin-like domain-containing protein [Agitococcus sp.]